MKQLIEYAPFIVLATQGLTVWFCWSIRQMAKREVDKMKEVYDAQLLALKLTQAGLEQRVSDLEGDVLVLPTKADIAHLNGRIDGLSAQMEGVGAGVSRIEGYFLERGVRG